VTPTSSVDQIPTITVSAPTDQAVLEAGTVTQVNVVASDDRAIARIELYVDNSLVESRVAPAGAALTTMSEVFTWSAAMLGPHSLQARVYDGAGQMAASRIVAVQVQMPGQASPTPSEGSPAPSLTPGVATPEPGSTPTIPAATQPPATATSASPLVTANLDANVRSGPGTNYSIVGGLAEGESALVTGRNAGTSWWQISYEGRSAWIANSVVTANTLAFNAPVVEAPPPPATNTPLPPTATSLPTATSGPTATPVPSTGFRIDQTTLNVGQCTTLRWDFDGIKAIYVTLGLGYDETGQDGHGSRQVCPSITTTYRARVIRQDSSQQTHELTATVSGTGCGADPYIMQFAPTTYEVASGQPFSVFWQVDCAKTVRYIKGSEPEVSVAGHGSKIDETITAETTFRLKVEKNDGTFVYKSFVVKLK
jgi:uncharacterized protein YraI